MVNSRIPPKERNLIKGAIRRVFSRSELRREVLNSAKIDYFDLNRKRVTKWGVCELCRLNIPLYLMQVDHKIPLVPLDKNLEDLTWDEIVDRCWCSRDNLQALCKICHKHKSKEEMKQRRALKKAKLLKNEV